MRSLIEPGSGPFGCGTIPALRGVCRAPLRRPAPESLVSPFEHCNHVFASFLHVAIVAA